MSSLERSESFSDPESNFLIPDIYSYELLLVLFFDSVNFLSFMPKCSRLVDAFVQNIVQSTSLQLLEQPVVTL